MPDKKWALEVSGTAPEFAVQILLRDAYSGESQWIKEVAFRQVAHLSDLPSDVAQGILTTIVNLKLDNRLKRESDALKAQLSRLSEPRIFISAMRLLLWLPRLDLGFHFVLYLILLSDFAMLRLLHPDTALNALIWLFISYCSFPFFTYFFKYLLFPLFSRKSWWLTPFKLVVLIGLFFSRISVFIILFGGWPGKAHGAFDFRSPMDVFTTGFALYVASFVPFAILAARKGKFTHPGWWALLPFWLLLYIAANIPSSVKRFLTIATANKKNPYFYLLIFVIILIISLIVIGVYFVFKYINSNNINSAISVAISSLFFMIIFISTATFYIQAVHDQMLYNRLTKQNKTVTCDELLKMIGSYYLDIFRLQVIKYVREKSLLTVNEEAEALLSGLVRDVEIKQRKRKNPNKLKSYDNESIKASVPSKYRHFTSSASPEILDEISKLLETVKVDG